MKTLQFTIDINASPERVWFTLWNDLSYRKWTSAFHPESYASSDWQQGSRIHFLTAGGDGMYANILEKIDNHRMVFQHLGEVKNFEEQPNNGTWKEALETYTLEPLNTGTRLTTSVDTEESFAEPLAKMFPNALEIARQLAENFYITVAALVQAPVESVWEKWTNPQHITKWNQANEDWHTPHAKNDLRVGGEFTSRMEAKDGSMGFDFRGVYTALDPYNLIEYEMEDGRKVKIRFEEQAGGTMVTESFEPEGTNSLDLQHAGWQAIMNSFKQYAEHS